jgi:hypothetical protein
MDSSYIVHYIEYGKSKEQAVFWFVMELLAGDPLDALLRDEGPWQEVDAIRVRARDPRARRIASVRPKSRACGRLRWCLSGYRRDTLEIPCPAGRRSTPADGEREREKRERRERERKREGEEREERETASTAAAHTHAARRARSLIRAQFHARVAHWPARARVS